jgi:glycosyltransferase involved in cell wall biosynthesis
VLHLVTETFPPEINGVSMTLGRLMDGLQQRNYQVRVIAPRRKDRNGMEMPVTMVAGLPIPRYPELRFGLPAHRSLRRIWHNERPDIVHIATEGPLGWSALRVARQLNIPTVSSFHTNFHSYGSHYGYGFLKRMVLGWLRHCHNRTRLTFVPSADVIRQLQSDGFANLKLLARGVDTALFGPHRRSPELRRDWGATPSTPVALYVGRLAGEKNLGLVVEAWQHMRSRLPELKLVLVGDGPARSALARQAPEAIFAGMRSGVDLAAHYASCDCFLFASITETFGNVVTEAMASSLPVLAYNYAAPARFISHQSNGFLAPFGDAPAFLSAAGTMADCRQRWPELGNQARNTVLPHSWDAIIDGYCEDIRPLLIPSQPPMP